MAHADPIINAQRLATIEQVLREGYAPPKVLGGRGSAVFEAANRLGIGPPQLYLQIKRGTIAPDWSLYEQPDRQPSEPRPAPAAAPAVAAVPPDAVARLHRRIVALEDENAGLKRDLLHAHREALDAEAVREEIIGISAISPDPPDWLAGSAVADASDHGPGTPMVLWSDWHWSEVVRRDEVGGVNEFNIEIGKARVKRLVDLVIRLALDCQVHQGYPGIVVCLGGDMISGEIHDELIQTNEIPTMPSLVDLRDVLIWAFERLITAFGRVFAPCVVGNHGRATLKPRAKSRIHTSYEWLLYTMLAKHFAGRPEIQFLIPNDIDVLFRVGSTRYLLTHGDALGVKGGDGIIGALGPIMRGAIKTRHSNAQVAKDFDVILMGHWHQYMALRWIIVNGSLKGYDEYARTMLRAGFELPIQALWYDHPRHGITSHQPIYLEDPAPAASGSWVDVFATVG